MEFSKEFYTGVGFVAVAVIVLIAKEIIGAYGKKIARNMTDTEEYHPPSCAAHPSVASQLAYTRRYLLWSGRLLFRICDKLEITDIPDEPQERGD